VPDDGGSKHQWNIDKSLPDYTAQKLRKELLPWVNFWVDDSLVALMMEGVQTSETSVNLCQSTRRYKSEDSHLHSHRREHLKPHVIVMFPQRLQLVTVDSFARRSSSVNVLHEPKFFYYARNPTALLHLTPSRRIKYVQGLSSTSPQPVPQYVTTIHPHYYRNLTAGKLQPYKHALLLSAISTTPI
jgi:hypothetical protein